MKKVSPLPSPRYAALTFLAVFAIFAAAHARLLYPGAYAPVTFTALNQTFAFTTRAFNRTQSESVQLNVHNYGDQIFFSRDTSRFSVRLCAQSDASEPYNETCTTQQITAIAPNSAETVIRLSVNDLTRLQLCAVDQDLCTLSVYLQYVGSTDSDTQEGAPPSEISCALQLVLQRVSDAQRARKSLRVHEYNPVFFADAPRTGIGMLQQAYDVTPQSDAESASVLAFKIFISFTSQQRSAGDIFLAVAQYYPDGAALNARSATTTQLDENDEDVMACVAGDAKCNDAPWWPSQTSSSSSSSSAPKYAHVIDTEELIAEAKKDFVWVRLGECTRTPCYYAVTLIVALAHGPTAKTRNSLFIEITGAGDFERLTVENITHNVQFYYTPFVYGQALTDSSHGKAIYRAKFWKRDALPYEVATRDCENNFHMLGRHRGDSFAAVTHTCNTVMQFAVYVTQLNEGAGVGAQVTATPANSTVIASDRAVKVVLQEPMQRIYLAVFEVTDASVESVKFKFDVESLPPGASIDFSTVQCEGDSFCAFPSYESACASRNIAQSVDEVQQTIDQSTCENGCSVLVAIKAVNLDNGAQLEFSLQASPIAYKGGLGVGALIGIILAALALISAAAYGVLRFMRRRKIEQQLAHNHEYGSDIGSEYVDYESVVHEAVNGNCINSSGPRGSQSINQQRF